jgi:uroporphyrinogen decarboxylase
MTPRERFLRAAERKWVDRVCNEFIGGSQTVTIVDQQPYGYSALCEYLGITDYAKPVSDPIWGNVVNVDERLLEKFNCDFRYVPPIPKDLEVLPNGYIRYCFGTLWKPCYGVSRSGTPRMTLAPEEEQPASRLKTLKELEDYPYWPDTESAQARQAMEKAAGEAAKIAKRLHEETDYAIVATDGNPYSSEKHRWVRGFRQWFKDMRENPEFFHAFASRMLQHGRDFAEIYLNAVGDYIDRIQAGPGDLGTQNGPMISLRDFREFVLPYQRESFKVIRRYTKAKICAHMCGSISIFIEDLASIGLDIVGQQIGFARDMEPEKLKQKYGNIITFWGGIDTQIALKSYTHEGIREWVKRCINALAPGYIAASNHLIECDIPPENIWVVHKAIEEFGRFS